jgi:hypothetical protein
MAATLQELEFVQATAGIRASVEGRLTALLTNLANEGLSPEVTRDAMARLTRTLVAEYGSAAAGFAADWYDDMRASAGVTGRYTAVPLTQDFDEQIDQTVRRAVGTLFTDEPDIAGMVNAIAVKAAEYAADGSKHTIAQNSYRDPMAAGWQRIPHGPTCDFCLMLVGRGGVYKRSTAYFRSHGHCDCGAAPSWDLNATEVPPIAYQASVKPSRMDSLRRRAADGDRSAQRQLEGYRSRVQSYIADNQGEFAKLRQTYNLTPA